MTTIPFHDRTQYAFWGNIEYVTNTEARRARDVFAKALKAEGKKTYKHMLRNQLRPYSGFGQPCGMIGNVYFVDVIHKKEEA